MSNKFITYKEAAERLGVTPSQIGDYARKGYFKIRKRVKFNVIYEDSFKEFAGNYFADAEAVENVRAAIDKEMAGLAEKRRVLDAELTALSARCWFYADGKNALEYIMHTLCTPLLEESGESSTILVDAHIKERERDVIIDVCRGRSVSEIASSYMLSPQRISQILRRSISKFKYAADIIRKHIVDNNELIQRAANQHGQIRMLQKQILQQNKRIESLERDLGYNNATHKTSAAINRRRLYAEGVKMTDFDLSVRTLNCLKSAEIDTLADLVACTREDMLKIRNFGKKSVYELDELLASSPGNFQFNWGMNLNSLS